MPAILVSLAQMVLEPGQRGKVVGALLADEGSNGPRDCSLSMVHRSNLKTQLVLCKYRNMIAL